MKALALVSTPAWWVKGRRKVRASPVLQTLLLLFMLLAMFGPLLNLLIWLAGFVIYRILMRVDTPVGSTLPDMAVTVVLCVVCRRVMAACCAVPGRENVTKV